MEAERKHKSARDISEAKSKLSRLLETENELETMLKGARREATELVEAAQRVAAERIRQVEVQLEGQTHELREQTARDRDEVIDSIREEARQETTRLDEADDAKIAALARHVIDLLLGRPNSRGER